MHALLLVLLVISNAAPGQEAPGARAAGELASMPGSDPVLERAQGLFGEALAARAAGDFGTARARASGGIEALLRPEAGELGQTRLALLEELGTLAHETGELRAAERARRRLLEVRAQALSEGDPELQQARTSLAITLHALGDLAGARALFEQALETCSRTLSDGDPGLQAARLNLAAAIRELDLPRARTLEEQVLEAYSKTLPDDHPDLQAARGNLALTIKELGDLAGAQALEEKVLDVFTRTLGDDHCHVQRARLNLADTIKALGDLSYARTLEEQALEVRERTLPEDHPELQDARMGLAVTLGKLGELSEARELLERALEVYSRTLPDEHDDLQEARNNLAITLKALGDLPGARALGERVLEVYSRTLPDEHPDLQTARMNLAITLKALGDLPGARALEEKVYEINAGTLPEGHPELQRARVNLAVTLGRLRDLAGARVLQEKVLEVYSRTLPDEHPDLQAARMNLATTLFLLRDPGARELQEQAFEIFSRTLTDDHPDLQRARMSLALMIARLESNGPAETIGDREANRDRCAELVLAACRAQTGAARQALLESSPREAQARCAAMADWLDIALSFAAGYGVFDPMPELDHASLLFGETTRAAALGSAALMRRAADAPAYAELRSNLRAYSDELARLARRGTTSAAFQAALARRDASQRELAVLARELAGGSPAGLEFDADALAGRLERSEAVVATRRYVSWRFEAGREQSLESFCAFVLRASGVSNSLTRVELGPAEPIEAAVRAWRAALGTEGGRGVGVVSLSAGAGDWEQHAPGRTLRQLVFDPLLPALAGAERVVMALDDVLHLVPIEALPMEVDAGGRSDLVGDRWRIETRCTLAELLAQAPEAPAAGGLLALGGAAYDLEPSARGADGDHRPLAAESAGIPRDGGRALTFAALPNASLEARGIAAVHMALGGGSEAIVLEGREASRAALEELAPGARWLHVATHGWFATESIRSWQDPEPLDRHSGLGKRPSGAEQVQGMSPMVLCGLALAGANRPETSAGRTQGLITAEELAALDLSDCELAVLSACDTNVGERMAGQGVASLQMALQMAGARSAITSLWKVPDEATKDLMLDFYRRLWIEKKPKWQALWEAKTRLRQAIDESGQPRYTTRDWAAWVLTGEPD